MGTNGVIEEGGKVRKEKNERHSKNGAEKVDRRRERAAE